MKHGSIYKVGSQWVLQTNGNTDFFQWANLYEALDVLSGYGWEFVSEVSHEMAEGGKAYLMRKA